MPVKIKLNPIKLLPEPPDSHYSMRLSNTPLLSQSKKIVTPTKSPLQHCKKFCLLFVIGSLIGRRCSTTTFFSHFPQPGPLCHDVSLKYSTEEDLCFAFSSVLKAYSVCLSILLCIYSRARRNSLTLFIALVHIKVTPDMDPLFGALLWTELYPAPKLYMLKP